MLFARLFESQISFVTLRVQRSVCINLYNIKKKLSDPPSLLCQIYADPPFLGRQKVNDPPLNSSGPPPLLKNECSLSPFSKFRQRLECGQLLFSEINIKFPVHRSNLMFI